MNPSPNSPNVKPCDPGDVHLGDLANEGSGKERSNADSYVVHPRVFGALNSDSETDFDVGPELKSTSSISSHARHIMDDTSSNGDEAAYQSADERQSLEDQMDMQVPPLQGDKLDLSHSIKGMYRVLDLISEQGSGGLVDKIIISQNSLQAFVNSVCPGAYASMTRVNFKALDDHVIKPVGIYGSKEEIVQFLLQIGAIDEVIATQLRIDAEVQTNTQPVLRSGLYILSSKQRVERSDPIFLLYWPETTTWSDSAAASVRRNRITFMRYLTKMCDQVISLISAEHAQTILWNDETSDDGDDMLDISGDDSDRMFSFEVAQTNEQEESVTVREGFKAVSRAIVPLEVCTDDADLRETPPITPFLLFGETTQGFMTVQYREAKVIWDTFTARSIEVMQLEALLTSDRLCLNAKMDEESLRILVRSGLEKRFPDLCRQWKCESTAVKSTSDLDAKKEIGTVSTTLQTELPAFQKLVFEATLDDVLRLYPCFDRGAFPLHGDDDAKHADDPKPQRLSAKIKGEIAYQVQALRMVDNLEYRTAKERIILFDELFQAMKKKYLRANEQTYTRMLDAILEGDPGVNETGSSGSSSTQHNVKMSLNPMPWIQNVRSLWKGWSLEKSDVDAIDQVVLRATQLTKKTSDSQFLTRLGTVVEHCVHGFPQLQFWADQATQRAFEYLEVNIPRLMKRFMKTVCKIREEEYTMEIKRSHAERAEEELGKLRAKLIELVNNLSTQTESLHTLSINNVEELRKERYYGLYFSTSYRIWGTRASQQNPVALYTVHLMNLTTQDQHELQLNPRARSSPRFRFSHTFALPLGYSVSRAQLLEGEKILLVITDRSGNLHIYLDRLVSIDGAIARDRGKQLNRERIGHEFLLIFDESKKMLAVISSNKFLLHIFVFNETRGFQALGSAINLRSWYPSADTLSIRRACFVSGSEEVLLVDSQAHARVFSLVTLQFRPAMLQLNEVPYSVDSTPDGACMLVAQAQGDNLALTAYHWSTFGSTEGIQLTDLGPLEVQNSPVVTSLINRTAVHVVTLDFDAHACRSHALDITSRVTEFIFKEKTVRGLSARSGMGTGAGVNVMAHNCLVDCHSEVWTRFPVLPAIQRETISSSNLRSARTLVFVTDRDHGRYASRVAELISAFERATQKPTGDVLKSVRVSAVSFPVFTAELCGEPSKTTREWKISAYRAGEWLVELLCLIPIHLALAKENRFVPLKDGVYSPELERSLLGASVNRIVDSLSFGWYESLFQSYMASKPVRVVSSMGEQSVGKSFALNHFADTSFAGSAMRTTEGVWMSVTPTQDALIVALDFEGVHSIERSAQEDTLLVLFNTAISNLVLFRNNFALSRDVTGLFQSFQSSSTVLDPKVNPSLFQSTLVIIIKDVVDSDKVEIVKEFSLKFQRIVQDEQEANFISRLHAGKLNIIPWPVIESKEFYRLFPALKRQLNQQVVTHRSAGEFLHLMKTLMAKLKANDWGAMSQTMAAHRAQVILSLLPNALSFGYAEVDPEKEPLKNLDTDELIDLPDSPYQLSIISDGENQSISPEHSLAVLRSSWEGHASRQYTTEGLWMAGLSGYLETIVNLRINHVHEWLDQNLARFHVTDGNGQSHAHIDELKRCFESSILDLRANVQLCGLMCGRCQLQCVLGRVHEGMHDCKSNHVCVHECNFCLELETGEHQPCRMSAGHPGKHICVANQHLCGKSCKFSGRHGCLSVCSKVIGHSDEEHLCAAPVHACGKPCGLSDIQLVGGGIYSCPGTCQHPSDVDHSLHRCDARFCTIQCQLCKRLCVDQDHMHSLNLGAIHLCGQEHLCADTCTSPGICEIETMPHSIEVTFTGRNETFQYTKYSQVAKRLKCTKPIPPGATKHEGSHNHSLDKKVVHFCEERCKNCGYFCTLPLGHPQQEHETRHGSMARTRWTVDGPEDVSLEIEGRKFSANDEGAPMMCNLVCSAMGRHVHVDYCRVDDEAVCTGNDELEHLQKRIHPDPDRAKDFITHNLFWKRSGFKDPYSREEQANFAKCDAMCGGPEHTAAVSGAAMPSYCVLPLFHEPLSPNTALASAGYISQDGHQFACKNPVVMQQAFHVIFAVDRSGSMGLDDRKPLTNTPATARISARSNNRYGAVLSSLHSFWMARTAAVAGSNSERRDAYSVVLFDHRAMTPIANDFSSTPDRLLDRLPDFEEDGGTNFTLAIRQAQVVMEQSWSTERSPVIIFLSDGECRIDDDVMQDLCRSAVRLGKAVSFHAVSFGPEGSSRYLRRMTDIARDAQNNAPRDPFMPAGATILSSYTQALDTIQLAETFLGIAESLRKPRGALMH